MTRTRKRVGVLGGMGPAATALFYRELVAHTEARCDQDHIDAVVLGHAGLPDRTGSLVGEAGEKDRGLFAELARDVGVLERAGVDVIAMPCNTAHRYYEDLCGIAAVPIIDMIDATVEKALAAVPGAATLGILCTDGTLRAGLYERACAQRGARAVYPAEQGQAAVMRLVYEHVKRGRGGGEGCFEEAYRDVKGRGADAVVLGCTELAVYRADHAVPVDCIDSLNALVRATIRWAGKGYRP